MATEDVRSAVLAALRQSDKSEHKVVLQELIATPVGDALLAGMERQGVPRTTFLAALAALPELQFYVPIRAQRLSWEASEEAIVASGVETKSPAFAFASDGSTTPLRLEDGVVPEGALFLIQRKEPMARRLTWNLVPAFRPLASLTIQDPADRDFGAEFVQLDAFDNVIRTVQLADLINGPLADGENCDPENALVECPPNFGIGPNPGLFLTRITNNGVYDNVCFFEEAEFEFDATPQFGSPETLARVTGIGTFETWLGNEPVSTTPAIGQWVDVHTRETDGFLNSDDHFYCMEGILDCTGGLEFAHADPRNGLGFNGQVWGWQLCEDSRFQCPKALSGLPVAVLEVEFRTTF